MAYPPKKQPRRLRKAQRIEASLNPEASTEQSASLKETSVSGFMISSTDEAAMSIIQAHEVWILNREDSEVVVQALLNPRPPNARMKAALRRYRQRVKAL